MKQSQMHVIGEIQVFHANQMVIGQRKWILVTMRWVYFWTFKERVSHIPEWEPLHSFPPAKRTPICALPSSKPVISRSRIHPFRCWTSRSWAKKKGHYRQRKTQGRTKWCRTWLFCCGVVCFTLEKGIEAGIWEYKSELVSSLRNKISI